MSEPENTDPPAEPLGEAGIKALQAERDARKAAEDRAKAAEAERDELKPKAQQWEEAEAANKSELERERERAAKAEEDAAKAAIAASRYRLAAKHQISEEDAELWLTATDEEALTKQAERFAELRQESPAPKTDPAQGARKPAVQDPWAAGKAEAAKRFGT